MSSSIEVVKLDSNVYEMMINHALSNEKEEVMGLLIGNVCCNFIVLLFYSSDLKILQIEDDPNDTKKYICNVRLSIILERLDKRADRVEISPEQLTIAAEYAAVQKH